MLASFHVEKAAAQLNWSWHRPACKLVVASETDHWRGPHNALSLSALTIKLCDSSSLRRSWPYEALPVFSRCPGVLIEIVTARDEKVDGLPEDS